MSEHYADKVHNRSERKAIRKKLRHDLTPAEAALWKVLQRSKIEGRKFRRQHSVGPYILDFYCSEEHLAIELDGEGHRNPLKYDHAQRRSLYLKSKNIRVLRFENHLVFDELELVIHRIMSEFGWWKKEDDK